MKLPFLKEKSWPRIAKPMDEKLINASADDHLDAHAATELMDSVESKDVKRFRDAIEALVLNCFEHEGDDDAA